MPADRLHPAPFAQLGVSPGWTLLEHSQVTEGKIVSDRVARIELGEGFRDLDRRVPIHCAAAREPQVSRQFMDVRVDGNDEPMHRDVPKTEVNAVVPPDHPTGEEQKALRSPTLSEIRQDVAWAATNFLRQEAPFGANRFHERAKPRPESLLFGGLGPRHANDEVAEGPLTMLYASRAIKKPRHVLTDEDTMPKVRKCRHQAIEAERIDALRERARETPSDFSQLREDRRDVAESER